METNNKAPFNEEQRAYAMQVAKTILSQIRATIGQSAMWSWGIAKSTATYTSHDYPAVVLDVNGRNYTGRVMIELDEAADTYNVYKVDRKGLAHLTDTDVYCDTLGEILDVMIEVGEDREEYEKFCRNTSAVLADMMRQEQQQK